MRSQAHPSTITPYENRLVASLLAGVAAAAGITGLVLLALPDETGRYFSWGLDPPPLAALIGGSYVASLVVFGLAIRRFWVEVRGLVAGTLALTLPILGATFTHVGVFDFRRWQAWGWVLLFVASPAFFGTVLWRRLRAVLPEGERLAPGARAAAGFLALLFGVVAVYLWIDPLGSAGVLFPFDLAPLGGRVLGSWLSFLAFLAGWVATHDRRQSWIPASGLACFPAGAFIGGLRTFGDLQPPGLRTAYLATLVMLTVIGGLVLADTRRPG
ncbi:MAG TPA: hypothetical protein VHL52_03970 [Acidimicrobiia bacterium]|nr:hypothetical protein [Acidimicrobiia bacterium]